MNKDTKVYKAFLELRRKIDALTDEAFNGVDGADLYQQLNDKIINDFNLTPAEKEELDNNFEVWCEELYDY